VWLVAGCTRAVDLPDNPVPDPVDDEAAIRELLGLPDHLEVPHVPADNPLTAEKIELGRYLFYDERLSGNETQACADCHLQELAFADGLHTPSGSTGDVLFRNSPGLANVAWFTTLTWAHSELLEFEDQLVVPITGELPVELGVNDGNEAEVLARFDDDPAYADRIAAAFPESDSGATLEKIVYALASFCRSLVSGNSAWDRYVAGDHDALDDQQKLGLALFNGEKFECFHCHGGVNLTTSYRDASIEPDALQLPFFNTGLYNVGGDGSYPAYDQGLYDVTIDPDHRGLFRPQSLRNVALTAPYMHDGSIATLREVIEHYAAGGRVIEEGAYAGDGRISPLKSGLVRGFTVTDEEIDAVIAFLESTTDETFLTNPAYSDPEP
jgi:cytochrome c peroxidase